MLAAVALIKKLALPVVSSIIPKAAPAPFPLTWNFPLAWAVLTPAVTIPNEPVEVAEPLMFPLAWIVPVTSNACVGADLRIPTCPAGSIAIAVIGVPDVLILKYIWGLVEWL